MSETITQKQIDKAVFLIKEEWAKMVSESGLDRAMFILTDKSAIKFIGQYEIIREGLEKEGWQLTDLVEGATITLS